LSDVKLIVYLIFIGQMPEKSSTAYGIKAKQVRAIWRRWLSMDFGREAVSTVG
jgi:hypothetical protein